MRNVYIINPKAGKHDHTVQFMERIRAVHATHGEEPEIYLTQRAGHGEELARAAAEKGDAVRIWAVGGDGTVLKAACRVGEKQIPMLGINMGRLGFLASVLPEEFATAVEDIYQGRYRIDSRSVIGIETEGEPLGIYPYALNDISLFKRDFAAMITVRATVDGQYLNTYQADGLVVSTPTGSTAYSLSNGGPIVVPQSKVLTLTPVAPHSMSTRPIVLPDTSEIRLEVKSRSHNFMIAIDGEATKLHEGTVMTIRRAPYDAKMVVRGDITYFSTLREKLMWGADPRQ